MMSSRHLAVWILVICALCVSDPSGMRAVEPGQDVRQPAVAGQFYPAQAGKLKAAIEGYLKDAMPARAAEPVALVVPHAGYAFSGQIMADGYRQVSDLAVDTVVILGTNHTSGTFSRVSVYDGAGYRTPLGVAAVDRDLAAALVKDGGGVFDASLHGAEHSVEVQVPFVQHLFPKATIVPVVVGSTDSGMCSRFGRALGALAKNRRVLLVASSDLSHYPAQREAVEVDRQTLEAMASLDASLFGQVTKGIAARRSASVATCACGEGPVRVAIEAARALGATRATVISYANSGDTVLGEADRVVGYGAVVFGRGEPGADTSVLKTVAPDASSPLDAADKRQLLRLARETIARYLASDTMPLPRGGSARLRRDAGVFVTLKIHGELRGCIGRLQAEGTLIRAVAKMALASAFEDSRFQPLQAGELDDVEVEISILTPMKLVAGPGTIVLGRDGVVLNVGNRSAVFLPQVAAEQGWNRTQLLENLAVKAGLPAQAWRGWDAKFLTFQADVFSEATLR
jgi:hypothetical protein